MRKIIAVLAVFLYLLTVLLSVSAQTSDPANANPQSTNLVGGLIAVAALILLFAVVGYAGYRMIRKWSSSQPE